MAKNDSGGDGRKRPAADDRAEVRRAQGRGPEDHGGHGLRLSRSPGWSTRRASRRVLVGDSMSMVVQGHENTLPVTLDEMIYHAEMVGRAVERALVVVDMPFPSYHLGKFKAIENAGRILKETRCQAVKLEGGAEQADMIAALVSAGHPRDGPLRAAAAERAPTRRLPRAARRGGAAARRPRRGRGRGVRDGAGVHPGGDRRRRSPRCCRFPRSASAPAPTATARCSCCTTCWGCRATTCRKFVKAYADLKTTVVDAVRQFRDEVRDGAFPGPEHAYE